MGTCKGIASVGALMLLAAFRLVKRSVSRASTSTEVDRGSPSRYSTTCWNPQVERCVSLRRACSSGRQVKPCTLGIRGSYRT